MASGFDIKIKINSARKIAKDHRFRRKWKSDKIFEG